MSSSVVGPKYTNHNGFLMPFGFPSENFDASLTYAVHDTDIFVTTYPKCGTTWVQNIIYLILNNGQPLAANLKLTEVFPHLEEVGKDFVEKLPHPRLIKTHLPYGMTPMNTSAKYVYVARNPKDCVVSFFHHTRGFVNTYDYEQGTFDEYFELFLNGKVDFGDYFDNLTSWLQHKSDPHVLFLTFEGMKGNTRKGVLDIATFLGQEHHDKLLRDNEKILEDVLKHSSLTSMQTDAQRWSSQRPEGHTAFIRSGQVGDWKKHFSTEQSAQMNKKIHQRMKTEDIKDLWSNIDLELDRNDV